MAQSTQQLQALLKDMGFPSPAPPATSAAAADPSASQDTAADPAPGAAKQPQDVYGDGSSSQGTPQLQQRQPLLPPPACTSSGSSPGGIPAEPQYQPTALQQSHPPQHRSSQHQSHRSQWQQGRQDSDGEVEQALVAAAAAAAADSKEQNMALQDFRRWSDREQQPLSAAPYSIPENQNEGGEGGSSGALLAAALDPLPDSHPEGGGRLSSGSGVCSRFAGEEPQIDVNGSCPQALDLAELPTLDRQQHLLNSSCLPRQQQQQQASADSTVAGSGQPSLLRPPGRSADGSSSADSSSAEHLRKTRPSSAPQVGRFALLRQR